MLEARSQTSIADVANQAPERHAQAAGRGLRPVARRLHPRRRPVRLQPGARARRRPLCRRRLLRDADRLDPRPARPRPGRDPARAAGHAGRPQLDRRRGEALFTQADRLERRLALGDLRLRNRIDLRGSADFALTDTLFAQLSGVSKQPGRLRHAARLRLRQSGRAACRSSTSVDKRLRGSARLGRRQLRGASRGRCAGCRPIGSRSTPRSTSPTTTAAPAAGVLVQTTSVGQPEHPAGAGRGRHGAADCPRSCLLPAPYCNYATFQNPTRGYTRPGTGATTAALQTSPEPRAKFKGWGVSGNVDWKLTRCAVAEVDHRLSRVRQLLLERQRSLAARQLARFRLRLTFHSFSQELRLNGAALDERCPRIHARRLLHGPDVDLPDDPGPALRGNRAHAVHRQRSGQRRHEGVVRPRLVCSDRPADPDRRPALHRRAQGLHLQPPHLYRRAASDARRPRWT